MTKQGLESWAVAPAAGGEAGDGRQGGPIFRGRRAPPCFPEAAGFRDSDAPRGNCRSGPTFLGKRGETPQGRPIYSGYRVASDGHGSPHLPGARTKQGHWQRGNSTMGAYSHLTSEGGTSRAPSDLNHA